MAETVTLTLPEEVAERAKEAARHTGRSLEAVLTEWLEREADQDVTIWLTPGAEYHIYTPYGNEAAAQGLLELLKASEVDNTEQDS